MANELTKVPEFLLFGIIENALKFIRDDYAGHSDKKKSFLSKVLDGVIIERYDLMKQAEEVFINIDESNQRFLECHMMFNMQREGLPTIHLTLPSEQTQSGGNGLGLDEGFKESIIDESAGTITPVYTRRFQSTYNIVITSDNSNEVILIYHTLRALLIALHPSIHLLGLQNPIFGGQDVQLYQGMATKNMYVRAITVSVQYETSVPSLFAKNILKNLLVTGNPVLE